MKPAVPWSVAAVLAMGLVGVFVHFQGVVTAKDAALQAAEEKYQALANESSAKLRSAQDSIEAANTRTKELASEADAKLQAQAEEAKAKMQDLSSAAAAQIQAANLPQVPVTVSFRKAMTGSGGVASIKNTSGQSIAVRVTAERPSANERRAFQTVIDAQQFKELGHREGWAFVKGDVVRIEQAGHKAVIHTYD